MKFRALGNLSGATGEVEKGAEFTAESTTGQTLVDRGLAEKIDATVRAADAAEPKGKALREKE